MIDKHSGTREMQGNRLKKRLLAGDLVFGAWVSSGAQINAEILSRVGFDFLLIDGEHGPGDLIDAASATAVAERFTPCIVRVPSADTTGIMRAIDAGITSIMVPMVTSAEMARNIVAATRYPPEGNRGYGAPVLRASSFGITAGYMRGANAEQLVIAQIETVESIERIPEIAASGVDALFIGPNDLAGSLGRLEELEHPDVVDAIARAEELILASGMPMGTVPSPARSISDAIAIGYKLIAGPSDVVLLRQGAIESKNSFDQMSPCGSKTTSEIGTVY